MTQPFPPTGQPPVPTPVREPTPPGKRIVPRPLIRSAAVMIGLTALLYLVEVVDQVGFHGALDYQFGIEPRQVDGLDGIAFAPLLHANWPHLFSNTVPFLLFGFLCLAAGLAPFISTTVLIWLISGIGVWLTGAGGGPTIGASGVIFGWLAYLLVRGIFNRSLAQLFISLVLLFYWGGALLGVLPGDPGISWQAHLFGAVGGVLAAWLTAKAASRTPAIAPAPPGSLPA